LAKPLAFGAIDLSERVRARHSVPYLRVFAWLLVIGLTVVTVVPASERPVTGVQHGYEHFLAFGFVGFTFALAYSRRPIALMLAAIAFTAALELIQIPLPTRHARLDDFLTDAVASCVGIGFGFLASLLARL
jgi:hypothetical protein